MNANRANVDKWATPEVADWLLENDFGAYADAFKKKRVNGHILMTLNASALARDMGIKA